MQNQILELKARILDLQDELAQHRGGTATLLQGLVKALNLETEDGKVNPAAILDAVEQLCERTEKEVENHD